MSKPLPRPVTTSEVYLAEILNVLQQMETKMGTVQNSASSEIEIKEPAKTTTPRKRRATKKTSK
jgi:hypothetical protein